MHCFHQNTVQYEGFSLLDTFRVLGRCAQFDTRLQGSIATCSVTAKGTVRLHTVINQADFVSW